ncbi:MAG: DUF4386 family protein [Chloroflexi bacterium]|nr:DUF4386 family protein [Chloroflexota bacterium]
MVVVRLGGLALLAFVPLLVAGVVLYGRIGISSQSDGLTALRRIADAGTTFPVMNALLHLGALLILPGAAALVVVLRNDRSDPWLVVATLFAILAVVVGAGFVFSLNHGLYGVARSFAVAPAEQQSAYAAAADMNLRTQAGAELVQSIGLGLWVLGIALAMNGTDWPAWLVVLGVAGGIGFLLAGLSSVLYGVAVVGPALGAAGALGLLLFVLWDLAVGVRLVTMQVG